MKIKVICQNHIEGYHQFDKATGNVAFLKHSHRHVFYITTTFNVTHTDRDIEIFTKEKLIKHKIQTQFGNPCEFGNMSCEDIAVWIIKNIGGVYSCKVTEDGAGGAIVYA